ncbi:MAG: hypothetical protein K0U84_08805 [Actinomycetia bacterium]|nr:hypothetical protein [Actinomycetes bacterium]
MPAEIFDQERQAWIAAHAGIWLIQKRRAELLGKRIRARIRAPITNPDTHDDQVTPWILMRKPTTQAGSLENALVMVAAVAAPLGWPLGRMLYTGLVGLIPERLQSYPIVALAWAAVLSGAPLPLLYSPSPSLTSTLIVPWLLAQLPATFASAAVYGGLEGWLAIDGSSEWWPLTPELRAVNANLILGPDPVLMPTLLDPVPTSAKPADTKHVPRRRPAPVNWFRVGIPAAITTAGALWYTTIVLRGVMSLPNELLS